MKNAIIYVFSGTGNTARIANLYKEEFEKHGVNTEIYELTADFSSAPRPDNYDLMGFAYPIHAFNAPHIMLDFARSLPKVDGKKYFVIKSSGEPLKMNNISSLKLRAILKRKGYTINSEYHYVMPYNMIFRHTDDMATRMWNTAKALAPIEAREVLADVPHMLKRVPFGGLIAMIMRIEHPAMRVNGRCFKADENKCIKCEKCINACPMHNIVRVNGKLRFGGNCLMCARCSFNCPTDAFNIALLNGWRINGKYNLCYEGEPQKNKHEWYCKKAYRKYFETAGQKIDGATADNGVQ